MQLCSFSMYCTVRKAFSWLTSNQEYLGQLDSNWILAPSSCPDTLYWYDSLWNWEKIGGKGLKPSWWWWCTIKFTVFVLGPSRLWTYFSKPWDCFNSLLSLMHCVHIDLTMLLLLLVLCVQITNVYWTHVFWSSWTCEPLTGHDNDLACIMVSESPLKLAMSWLASCFLLHPRNFCLWHDLSSF